jgi:hypothetical protein
MVMRKVRKTIRKGVQLGATVDSPQAIGTPQEAMCWKKTYEDTCKCLPGASETGVVANYSLIDCVTIIANDDRC